MRPCRVASSPRNGSLGSCDDRSTPEDRTDIASNLNSVGAWARVRDLDDRINGAINSRRPEDLARRWWWYLIAAAINIVLAWTMFALGADTASLALLVPMVVAGFLSGFYYCERLRSQGKKRGRYGPSRMRD